MNKPLNALTKKLNWQLDELHMHLHEAQNKSKDTLQKIQMIEEKNQQSCVKPLIINPELEISKLNFMTQQQEKKEELLSTLKEHQALEQKLQERIKRIKTELKMLEKYLHREELNQIALEKKAQDNALDEWVIQKREAP